jgi:hypothetical protein
MIHSKHLKTQQRRTTTQNNQMGSFWFWFFSYSKMDWEFYKQQNHTPKVDTLKKNNTSILNIHDEQVFGQEILNLTVIPRDNITD